MKKVIMKKTIYFSLAFIICLCFAILKLIMPTIFIFFQNIKLKRNIAVVLFILVSTVIESNAQNKFEQTLLLKTINYDLDIQVDYGENNGCLI